MALRGLLASMFARYRSRPFGRAMSWPRIDVFEFHDQPWCPAFLRQAVTDCVTTAWIFTGLWRNTLPHLAELLERSKTAHIVDLCSGSGGPLPLIVAELANRFPELRATLTDLYPKPQIESGLSAEAQQRIHYHRAPVNALDVPRELQGTRTIFSAVHHFPPDAVVKMLASASAAGQPIALFEFQRRALFSNFVPPTGLVGLSPIVALFLAPFRWWRWALTLIPVIPALWMWDSTATILRTYTPEELAEFAKQAQAPGYRWEVREASSNGKERITCVLGFRDDRGGVEIVRY